MLRSLLTTSTSCVVLTCVLAAPAPADWNPGDDHKMHYPQLPDLEPTGMDVLAGLAFQPHEQIKWLADDFLCTQTGPITDIHIWGSWLNDYYPDTAAGGHGTFVLGLYDDIPATPTSHSRPGNLLWHQTFKPGEYIPRLYTHAQEQFYDPNIDQIIGADTQVWQYNFFIDEPLALHQEEGKIYWLAVTNVDPNGDGFINTLDLASALQGFNRFGWKTSRDHFNDDAVFIDTPIPFGAPADLIAPPPGAPVPGMPWHEMRYPSSHPFGGQSIDLAFVITPEPATLVLLALGAVSLVRRS